jgi:hypothetical protein
MRAAAACAALLVAVFAGCGGPEPAFDSSPDESAESASAPANASPPSPVPLPANPTLGEGEVDVDATFAEILVILDEAYDDAGRPAPSFENLGTVQDLAFDRLREGPFQWPSGTSYSLSTLNDHIFVYVSCGDREKEGHWFPG